MRGVTGVKGGKNYFLLSQLLAPAFVVKLIAKIIE